MSRIFVIVRWKGLTKELYEKARKMVKWDMDVPKGAVIHSSAFDSEGIIVFDVWESESDFNNFIQKRLMPVTSKMLKTEPKVEIHPMHALLTYSK